MNERIQSLTKHRAILFADVQAKASRLSIPAYICELYDLPPGATIQLSVERRGQVFEGPFAMSSGYEIVPKEQDRRLRKILKPGTRVKVTVAPIAASRI